MRIPSYTTRMMLAFVLLALLAGALSVLGTYRIRQSLEHMKVVFHENQTQVELALKLHAEIEERSAAETMYINTRDSKYRRAWEQTDKNISRILSRFKKLDATPPARLALNAIFNANTPVRERWFQLTSNRSPKMLDKKALRQMSLLESKVDAFTNSRIRTTDIAEDSAVREGQITLVGNLLLSALVLGLAAVMALYISKTLRKPLDDLIAATQKITGGQLGHRLDLDRSDEIGALTTAFDEMSSELLRKDVRINNQLEQLQKTKSLLESYSDSLEKKNKEMESFIYSVSHDLKAPLIAIQGFLAMFAEEFSSTLSNKAAFYLDRVQANGQQMQMLIAHLLELSRAGQPAVNFTTVPSKDLALAVVGDLHVQIKAKGAKISLTGDWPSIVAEPGRIKQALTNLVDNALHYGRGDGAIKIDISCEECDDFWRFSVKDNGIGIDPRYQTKVFDMFERLSDSHKKNIHGTGMGLAIVKKIAESHGGTAGVKSKLGKGSTFFFEISGSLKASDKANAEVRI